MATNENGTHTIDTARAVARAVVLHGPVSRSEVARRLGLSPASMTRLSKPLIEQGLLVESDVVADPGHGRLVRPLDVSAALRFVGIKIAVGAVHGVLTDARATILAHLDEPLTTSDPDEVIRAAGVLIDRLSAGERVHSVGVSLGGHTDDHSSVVLSRSLGWRSVALGERLTEVSGLPVVVENDVTALTVAHHLFSSDRDSDRFALVTVGVGVGCGLVINGDVVRQLDATSPSPSMMILNPAGPTVPEGPRGSALAYLASTNVAIAASAASGRVLSFDEAIELARDGDTVVRQVITERAAYLGRFIAGIATLSYVTRFILSGEGIAIAEVGEDAMNDAIAESRPGWSTPLDIDVAPTTMRDWARGAASVAIWAMIENYSADDRW
ncbi:ROK family transcriptional regulator [Microbacterium sp. 1.5R]|uniref:ROK family transcriptional regulator n=1 Tax=Microbacterium sp. 1.5R TaxID=1916917 RepID=UPI00119E1F52|nr:ROK family transcriptional regulator [Microbacterium sp. 1.5R]